jgi:endonuclease G
MKPTISILGVLLLVTTAVLPQDLKPVSSTGQIITHKNYTLSYSEQHEQAEWVFYYLSTEDITGSAQRTNDFREDPAVSTGSATLADYHGSGYDRGHLSPAADNSANAQAMSESFYMSNMSPQTPGFNRGIWRSLEELFRTWSASHDGMYVVAAGILQENLPTIGPNKVSVPRYYYKIAYDASRQKMIAFILPNQSSQLPLEHYMVTVDSVETLSGIDFFPALPDSLENILESHSDFSIWNQGNITPIRKPDPSSHKLSVQCAGIAKSTGVQCKNKTTEPNGYCYLHQNQANDTLENIILPPKRTVSVQCKGTTKSGTRCKNKTLNVSGYCYLHAH